ncbi:MAG TPA: hypothetical protein VE007_06870 [Thermoanaerobaculia bacterium]|nr:hypothetical protein [Thermoanaerobaculia bacterium]
MRALASRFAFALLVLALAAACTTNPAPPPSSDAGVPPPAAPDRERRGGNLVADFAAMMSGRWEGVTPGNRLHADIESAGFHSLRHPYDLFLEVSGTFDEDNVREQGFMHLESQGRGVYLGYIPHFDPTVSSLSPRATRFTASEANAACALYMEPQGDGFFGEVQGTTCAFAIRGAIGKWNLRVEPGTLVVQSVSSGETLRFRRTGR